MSDAAPLYCVKMRASRGGAHVSGAERIAGAGALAQIASALVARAVSHPKGEPDFINVKVERAGAIERLDALEVRTHEAATPEEGLCIAEELLREAGVANARAAVEMLLAAPPMRGAMLVDAKTLERLDGGGERGVRATNMDREGTGGVEREAGKNHFSEALVLATKVANAPGVVAEICISDDPDYVTGYVASRTLGYRRITAMKRPGVPRGGRIFFYAGARDGVAAAVRWLETQCVLVSGAAASAPHGESAPPASAADSFAEELARIKSQGLYRKCRPAPAGTVVLGSNDYLGLARDPRVAQAAAGAALRYGAGAGGSRLAAGDLEIHEELERRLAAFKHSEDAVLFTTGYMANLGVLSAIAGKDDAVFSDELNHASIIDACRLSRARTSVYPHGDLDALDRMLAAAKSSSPAPRRLVAVSDGVFSMDGDLLDLPRFLEVCRRHGAVSVVDEAHATGVVGATGRGLAEHFGCDAPDITVGTLSKALGSTGGFAATSRILAEYLRNKARSFIFTTAPVPAAAAAALKALDIIETEPALVAKLRRNVRIFVDALDGIDGLRGQSGHASAIVPVVVGDERRALEVSKAMETAGFCVPAIRYPTVPRGQARLRFAISAACAEGVLVSAAAALRAAMKNGGIY